MEKNNNLEPIYVVGYPKSGTTYLTWLLADAINCPSGASIPEDDEIEVATEGKNRPGNYVVRKGHYVLVDDTVGIYKEFIPERHRMVREYYQGQKIIVIMRDPRDIVVSAKHYFQGGSHSISEMIGYIIRGENAFREIGPLNVYFNSWINAGIGLMVKYENLIADPKVIISNIIFELGIPILDESRIDRAIKRQSLSAKKRRFQINIKSKNRDVGLRLLRKGTSGDWKEEFSQSDKKMLAEAFNQLLLKLGYEDDPVWWKND